MTDREIFVAVVERVAADPSSGTVRVSDAELDALERVADALPVRLDLDATGSKRFMGRALQVAR